MEDLYKIGFYLENKTKPHPEFKPIDINQINLVENGQADTVFINCLEYFPNPEVILVEVCKKVKIGGEIIVEGQEIYEICRDILMGIIQPDDINNKLYSGKISTTSCIQLNKIFKDSNWIILEKDIDNLRYMIKARRNV